jgi:hypothetical protein
VVLQKVRLFLITFLFLRYSLFAFYSFDKEGFSIWRVDFKYNEELTQTFMSNNQVGGFFNRLEASRKYLFGSVGVLGKTNDSRISGVFIMRGQKVEGVVDAAPDWESYEYVRLDLEKEDDKKFFEAALAWDLELDGKAWADGKNVRFFFFSLLLSFLLVILMRTSFFCSSSKRPNLTLDFSYYRDGNDDNLLAIMYIATVYTSLDKDFKIKSVLSV